MRVSTRLVQLLKVDVRMKISPLAVLPEIEVVPWK
jgi:hypothetical protein